MNEIQDSNNVDLLTKIILGVDSAKRRLNINQVSHAYIKSRHLLEKAAPLFDHNCIQNEGWHEQFLILLGVHGSQRELTSKDMEELSDRAVRLHNFFNQILGEN